MERSREGGLRSGGQVCEDKVIRHCETLGFVFSAALTDSGRLALYVVVFLFLPRVMFLWLLSQRYVVSGHNVLLSGRF